MAAPVVFVCSSRTGRTTCIYQQDLLELDTHTKCRASCGLHTSMCSGYGFLPYFLYINNNLLIHRCRADHVVQCHRSPYDTILTILASQ